MNKNIASFFTDRFPSFVERDHENFKLFVEAYFEWLEVNNSEEYDGVKELYKDLQNSGGLITNAEKYLDVDTTLDGFIDYFRKEVIPVSIENIIGDKRLAIKKVRDLYLSKGTSKSFELFFRLFYDQKIDIFETENDIIVPSESKYVALPICYFKVLSQPSEMQFVNFTFSQIEELKSTQRTLSDRFVTLLTVLLMSLLLGIEDKGIKLVIDSSTLPRIELTVKAVTVLLPVLIPLDVLRRLTV